MKLGISSYTFGWAIGIPERGIKPSLTEQGLIAFAKHFRVDTIQLGDNLPVHEWPLKRLKEFAARTADEGIRVELGARGLTFEHLLRYVELAHIVNAPLIRFVTDNSLHEPSVPTIIETLQLALPELRSANVKVGIENHDRLKARELAFIMESVSSRAVGVCLDSANSLGAGEGLDTVIAELAPHTINLHIKDFTITRLPHKMGFTVEGARAGNGMTDIPNLLEKVSLYNRCESAILEQWVPPGDDIHETIAKEKQWAADGVAYLLSLPQFVSLKEKD